MNTRSALGRHRLALLLCGALVAVAITASVILIGQQPLDSASAAPQLSADSLTDADGVIREEDAVSVFDEVPAVTNLDPALLAAVRTAASAAELDGVRMQVNSGWRSAAYQQVLRQDAVVEYGSEEEAARWVAPPENSEHVSGDAVDLGPLPAQDWLAQRGAEFGLCQIYANERWHFELRPAAVANGCPLMYDDPTADPRTQG
ncbi:peptidase M15 [Microbacterium foliorum]|uniref:D-alanyl-D-alanine carboxypeptidase n=1 Tax=Microbacterium foliorum TaxID=104336 RepID=A0A0F0KJF4_9MICO|nr:M15 family metallopeptidase [Microbacterium foliorum]AXL10977.1 peptidase M15 [Microbacterium foliorum]KJL20260.1 D-alanyl-D-alanine carboxypeptidase [Microbacterium foliorum]